MFGGAVAVLFLGACRHWSLMSLQEKPVVSVVHEGREIDLELNTPQDLADGVRQGVVDMLFVLCCRFRHPRHALPGYHYSYVQQSAALHGARQDEQPGLGAVAQRHQCTTCDCGTTTPRAGIAAREAATGRPQAVL